MDARPVRIHLVGTSRAILKIADSGNPPLRVFFGIQGNQIVPRVYADRQETWTDWHRFATEAHGHTPPPNV